MKKYFMLRLPDYISLLRIPLALAFPFVDDFWRMVIIVLAMISDGLDGFIARRWNMGSKVGTILDPFTDRFFTFLVIGVFLFESKFTFLEAGCLVARDFALLIFGFHLLFTKQHKNYPIRAIWCGKVTTFLQFIVFLAVVWGYPIPPFIFGVFLLLGVLAFAEVFMIKLRKL